MPPSEATLPRPNVLGVLKFSCDTNAAVRPTQLVVPGTTAAVWIGLPAEATPPVAARTPVTAVLTMAARAKMSGIRAEDDLLHVVPTRL
jgi:hypothetical protein